MGRELQAADLYAHTAKAFEEVVLLLTGQDDALRAYLAAKLDVLPKSVGSSPNRDWQGWSSSRVCVRVDEKCEDGAGDVVVGHVPC